MIWSVIQVVGGQGISFGVMLILAALLSPADFGVVGMANIWLAFVQTFSELGFGPALIQKRHASSAQFSSVFFINIATGVLLAVAGVLLSWPCATFFSNTKVQPIMAFLSLGILINSFSLTQIAITQKNLNFKAMAVRGVLSSLGGGLLGVVGALGGWGVWSLVVQSLATNSIGAILLWRLSPWRPKWKDFSMTHVRELWGYGARISAFNFFKFFAQNLDKLIVGHMLGAAALGLYSFAYTLVVQPVAVLVGAIGNYLFPKLASIQEDVVRVRALCLLTAKSVGVLLLPWLLVLFFMAGEIVSVAWGPRWGMAVTAIRFFCGMAFVFAFVSPVGQLMKALNRPEWLFKYSVFIAVLGGGLIFFGTRAWGISGAAAGLTLSYVLGLPFNFWILKQLTHARITDIFRALWPIPTRADGENILHRIRKELAGIRSIRSAPSGIKEKLIL